ncbi:MMPL family transporter [Kibdelosporangium aridum]|uniref:Putative drug exporter of the RND superfamily n=1 Tax=Kibdelosporangium aridum TaxID=2030 RepID=A0A1Y5XJS6_KIBAR|nr:MMPL family transporter [Kibdelosporangium aridum]SMC92742.1 putative drug exporter of the RND superfamily [Kibdelosporangium aridum]
MTANSQNSGRTAEDRLGGLYGMEKLSRYVLAHKRLVGWLTVGVVLLGGAALALLLPNVSERNAYPGLPGYEANQKILQTYGTGGYERPFVPVITLPQGVTAQDVGPAFDAVARQTKSRVASYANTGDSRFVGGQTTFGLVFGGPVEQGGIPGSALGEGSEFHTAIDAIMRPLLPPGSTLDVTGLDALATGADTGGLNVPVKLLITIGAAIVILAWVFRSALAFVPLLTALIALPVSFIGLLMASLVIDVHETTLTMIPLFGLGIAIDYALILVSRWREEGDVHRAMATAGHAIVFSSGAVAIGLLAMIVLPVPIMRSLGIGGMIVTAASALVSLTVLPLLLTKAKPEKESTAWAKWAATIVKHRWSALISAAGVLVALSIAALGINLNVPTTDNLARSGSGHDGLVALTQAGIPSGVLTAFDVYVPPGVVGVDETLRSLPGVYAVAAPWDGLLTVLPVEEGGSEAGEDTIHRVRAAVPDGVLVGGNVTQQIDYVEVTYRAFPWLLGLIAVITFVMLARAFRSIVLPLKAIAMNLLSLGAVLGATVILWQWGWGTEAVLGIQPDGAVGTFIPVTVFAFLYGLSMDYEVFILARMREEYDRTGSTHQAVIQGIGKTGRLVTCAALILFFSFAAMATGGELDVAIFASAVGLGILIDATLIRSVLVPAVVATMGKWNWWLPGWAATVLKVRSSPKS